MVVQRINIMVLPYTQRQTNNTDNKLNEGATVKRW